MPPAFERRIDPCTSGHQSVRQNKKLAVSTRILSRGPCEEVPGVDMIKHKETKGKVYNSPLFLGLNRAICKAGFQSAEGFVSGPLL